ncbi:MAG TPA: SAM-dependent methyltransferase [Candidatus Limnocylindrales bacterium]
MDLRREPARGVDAASDPVLLEAIRAAIAASGPMTFARFMEIALYDPARGYYRGAVARPGRAGDFLTAPEASPIFGRTVARFAAAVHAAIGAPPTFDIREHGAGTGALAAPLAAALLVTDGGPSAIRYLVAEVEPARVDAIRSALADLPNADVEPDDGRPIDGLVIANEVLDALPIHRVVRRGNVLREVHVGTARDGALIDVEADPSTPALADRLAAEAVELADGQHAEICLALEGWIERAAAELTRGVLLLVDYGHPAAELYDPRRRAAGTLATYQGHQVGEDPYRAIGRQDITAHVDVTAVERAAARAHLDHLGTTTQAEFLSRLGAGELLVAEQTSPGADLQSYLETRSALVRMIDPGAMGRFRVMAFGRGLDPGAALPGLR